MRISLTILITIAFLFTKAQSSIPVNTLGVEGAGWHPSRPYSFTDSGNLLKPTWQLRPFASISAGYLFFNGGGSSYLAATAGLALIRPLNKNVSAFAAISASPAVFSINGLYMQGAGKPFYPGTGFSKPYELGLNARFEGGLMYTNDAKTFSISGSVGIERSSSPIYPYYQPTQRK